MISVNSSIQKEDIMQVNLEVLDQKYGTPKAHKGFINPILMHLGLGPMILSSMIFQIVVNIHYPNSKDRGKDVLI